MGRATDAPPVGGAPASRHDRGLPLGARPGALPALLGTAARLRLLLGLRLLGGLGFGLFVVGPGFGLFVVGLGFGLFVVGLGFGLFVVGLGLGLLVVGLGVGLFVVGLGFGLFVVGLGFGLFVVGLGFGLFVVGLGLGLGLILGLEGGLLLRRFLLVPDARLVGVALAGARLRLVGGLLLVGLLALQVVLVGLGDLAVLDRAQPALHLLDVLGGLGLDPSLEPVEVRTDRTLVEASPARDLLDRSCGSMVDVHRDQREPVPERVEGDGADVLRAVGGLPADVLVGHLGDDEGAEGTLEHPHLLGDLDPSLAVLLVLDLGVDLVGTEHKLRPALVLGPALVGVLARDRDEHVLLDGHPTLDAVASGCSATLALAARLACDLVDDALHGAAGARKECLRAARALELGLAEVEGRLGGRPAAAVLLELLLGKLRGLLTDVLGRLAGTLRGFAGKHLGRGVTGRGGDELHDARCAVLRRVLDRVERRLHGISGGLVGVACVGGVLQAVARGVGGLLALLVRAAGCVLRIATRLIR